MLVAPERRSVEVRSGQREQLVIRWADGWGLYVFSEHGICVSDEHQWPWAHAAQAVAPVALAYVPGVQGLQLSLPLWLANVPSGHGLGEMLPMTLKKPGGVVVHCSRLCRSVRLP